MEMMEMEEDGGKAGRRGVMAMEVEGLRGGYGGPFFFSLSLSL